MVSNASIDRLGERLKIKITEEDLQALDEFRNSFQDDYAEVMRTLSETIDFPASGRSSKSTLSIVAKLKRGSTRLSQIQDIAGCRVVVPTILDQPLVVGKITSRLVCRMEDRRSNPSFGYRAVHLITRIGKPIEIQIRTRLQHLWAEMSERLADLKGHEIKYGMGAESDRRILSQASLLVAALEHEVAIKWFERLTMEKTLGIPHSNESFFEPVELSKVRLELEGIFERFIQQPRG